MYPEELRYTEAHEWVRDEAGRITVGITAYAAEQLGDVTYVELPEPGRSVEAGEETAVVESVKAASDVFSPVAGEVDDVNDALENHPELVNESPHDKGWFFTLKDYDASGLNTLMDAAAYAEYVEQQEQGR